MPIYEYRCDKCGQFEIMQKITERALKRCPTCQGEVTKLISNTSFQLKGSGWYVTDYARRDGAGGNGSGKATGPKAESPSAAGEKKESKPSKSPEPAAA
jgi:putative FmdB family regulatory protein